MNKEQALNELTGLGDFYYELHECDERTERKDKDNMCKHIKLSEKAEGYIENILNRGIDRKDIKRSKSLKQNNHTIKITVKGGVVTDVDNLPTKWDYELHDYDN